MMHRVFCVCEWHKLFKLTGQPRVIERNYCYVWVLMVVVAWCKNGAETIYSHKVHGWVSLSEVHLAHLRHISKDPGRSPKVKSIAMPYSHTSFGILVGPGTGATYEWKRGSGCKSLKFLLRFMDPDFLWESFVVCSFYEAPSLDFFFGVGGMKMSFDFIHRCLHHLFFWRWCWRGIELYSKPLLSDFMIYWSSLESYCTFASMFNEPFLTFISKLPPAKSIEQCGPNFTDGAVDCQPMERWKDDIGHWHWVLVIWFLFNGFCHVQRVSEKQSTIFIHFS